MLKTIRIILALLSITAVTLLFLDFTGTAASLWPWMAKIQFMPAVLSANAAALLLIAVMTLLFGRIYCSVICPLGIFQDCVNWLRGHVGAKRKRINRFRYEQAHTRTRLIVLTVFAVLVILGLTHLLAASLAGLIEPYSAYGRMASQIFAPIYDGVNNLLARWSESRVNDYAFYRVAISVSIPVLVIAIVTMITVVAFAWLGGRDYCNTICPVGTILGYVSKYSLLKPVINVDKCVSCGLCARNCKAKCIDPKAHKIDYTRCVDCMDCIGKCHTGAIQYTWCHIAQKHDEAPQPVDKTRRGFVSAVGVIVGAAAMDAIAKTTDGGLTALKEKQPAQRQMRVVPAGAVSLKHLSRHCTACQLCIQSCPSGILKPTLSLDGFMQPHLDFTNGCCDIECNTCSTVCPVGAFHPINTIEKAAIKIGTAVVDPEACISASDGKKCGACASYCPAGAITMVHDPATGNMRPAVDEEACIGCGACEYHCPAGTVEGMRQASSAIHVEGIDTHRNI